MAKPMIFTDDTRPSHFAFANQIGVQTDEDEKEAAQIPHELRRTIESHLWLANLEASLGITMSANSGMPRQPHPDGPTVMTRNPLACAQIALEEAHAAHDVSRMLRGVVSNMHLLAIFSREARFTPYLGHAHYVYACYLKSQINSSRPPSSCDLGLV